MLHGKYVTILLPASVRVTGGSSPLFLREERRRRVREIRRDFRQEILIAHVLREEVITPSRLGTGTCD